jgi:hypothetical protein
MNSSLIDIQPKHTLVQLRDSIVRDPELYVHQWHRRPSSASSSVQGGSNPFEDLFLLLNYWVFRARFDRVGAGSILYVVKYIYTLVDNSRFATEKITEIFCET